MRISSLLLCSATLLTPLPFCPFISKAEAAYHHTEAPHERAVTVFEAGHGNTYQSIRIPDIIKAGDMLIAMAEGRYDNTDQGRNDLIVSISHNNGKTWTRPHVAAASQGATFNNPCLIYDEESKWIILFFQRYPAGVHERDKDIPTGWSDERCIRNFVSLSRDGKSWTKPHDITPHTKNHGVTITCSGPNPGVQIKHGKYKGRLVVPLNEGPFGNWTLAAAWSDDHGRTWHIGKKSEAGRGVNEVSIAETDGGGLVIISRAWGGNQRKIAYSDNGGETWGAIADHPELPSPNCQNGLVRYSFADDASLGGKSRLIFSTPAAHNRTDGTVKMSYDNGKTWPVSKLVIPGPFAYSTLVSVKPGTVGMLYEVNSNRITTIKFTTFSIKWLTDGKDKGVK